MWWSSGSIEGLEVVVLRRSVMNGRKARLSRVSSRALNSPAAPTTGLLRDSLDTSRRHDWTAPGSYVRVHGVACSRCPTTRSFGQVGSFATGGAAASEKSATRTPVTAHFTRTAPGVGVQPFLHTRFFARMCSTRPSLTSAKFPALTSNTAQLCRSTTRWGLDGGPMTTVF